jgi:amidohydrolase
MLKETIKNLAKQYLPEVIALRRHLHMHPELSTLEFNTSAFISKTLTEWGIEHQTGVAGTGIVAHITGTLPSSKTIALRADMDALPITEETGLPFKSIHEGVMHACGHDVHMSSLLGTAMILNQLKNEFGGTIRLIFQPSEEKYPGGASVMIREGVLENPVPSAIFGQHVYPELPAGSIGMKPGKYMASTDEIYLTVKGKGGHAATPHLTVDPIAIGAQIVVALQQIVSRNALPTMPTVISFGKFIANGRTNIIPDTAQIEGTIRTFDEQWRAEAHRLITRTARGIAKSLGAECEVFIDKGYPFLVNNEDLTLKTRDSAIEFLGSEKVVDLDLRMTAEDFAYYSQIIPGCFYRLGIMDPAIGKASGLHSATFTIDETSLETGMGLMTWLAIKELSN